MPSKNPTLAGSVLRSSSTARGVSPNYPYMGYAYAAVCITPSGRISCTVIYAGFSDGKHHVRLPGKNSKCIDAKRISKLHEPPVFEF